MVLLDVPDSQDPGSEIENEFFQPNVPFEIGKFD